VSCISLSHRIGRLTSHKSEIWQKLMTMHYQYIYIYEAYEEVNDNGMEK
jgi:hypothetical protein